jgi:hypothetical protein
MFGVVIQLFGYYCYSYYSIAFNGDQIVPPIMSDTCITQPGSAQQHGIRGIQNIVFYDCEGGNVWNPMDLDFEILNESIWFGDYLIHEIRSVYDVDLQLGNLNCLYSSSIMMLMLDPPSSRTFSMIFLLTWTFIITVWGSITTYMVTGFGPTWGIFFFLKNNLA